MKRLFIFASLSLLALSSSVFADKKNPHKPQNQTNKPQAIIRDHRTPNDKPVIRDHRTSSGNSQAKLQTGFNGLSNQSGGGYVNSNGIVQRTPPVNNKPQASMLTHQMSPQTPSRDPRPLTSHPITPRVPPRDPRTLTSQDLVSPGAEDQRFTPVTGSSHVVRDHRNSSNYGYQSSYGGKRQVSDMSGGVKVTQQTGNTGKPNIVDSRVVVAPQLSPRGTPPVVRDHRVSASTANYNWPSINQTTGPVVRDHRSNGSQVDNTIYGTGPGLHSAVDAAGSGLTSVGNAFGIGYGSVTSGAPTRPQVVDHRSR